MKTKKFYIYKTTFLPTGQIYIGYHGSTNIEQDKYIGSGLVMTHLKRKYGREHFHREILFSFDTEEEAQKSEKEIVNEEFIKRKDVLNVSVGGQGGGGVARCLTHEQRKANAKKAAEKLRGRTKASHQYLQNAGKKISNRFLSMSLAERKIHGLKCLKWMQDENNKKSSIEKRAQKLIGRNKLNDRGRASQAERISGSLNGSAKQARARHAVLEQLDFKKIPLDLFAKKYSFDKQLLALEHLVTGAASQGEVAKIAEMPVSSFNAFVAKLVRWASQQ